MSTEGVEQPVQGAPQRPKIMARVSTDTLAVLLKWSDRGRELRSIMHLDPALSAQAKELDDAIVEVQSAVTNAIAVAVYDQNSAFNRGYCDECWDPMGGRSTGFADPLTCVFECKRCAGTPVGNEARRVSLERLGPKANPS